MVQINPLSLENAIFKVPEENAWQIYPRQDTRNASRFAALQSGIKQRAFNGIEISRSSTTLNVLVPTTASLFLVETDL